jgi:hypothetical protein
MLARFRVAANLNRKREKKTCFLATLRLLCREYAPNSGISGRISDGTSGEIYEGHACAEGLAREELQFLAEYSSLGEELILEKFCQFVSLTDGKPDKVCAETRS